MKQVAVFFFLAAIAVCFAKHPIVAVDKRTDNDDESVREILNNVMQLRPGQKFEGEDHDLGFSWSNCGNIIYFIIL